MIGARTFDETCPACGDAGVRQELRQWQLLGDRMSAVCVCPACRAVLLAFAVYRLTVLSAPATGPAAAARP